jgi:hypothetical protein
MVQKRIHNLTVNQRCLLIAEPGGQVPNSAAQFAQLRGLEVLQIPAPEAPLCSADGSAPLIATSFAALHQMATGERESVHDSVNRGATLYVRGAAHDGIRYQLAPLIESSFTVGLTKVASYRFTDHGMIPSVLRGEETPLGGALNCVSDLTGPIEPILLARDEQGAEAPVVFAYRLGKGAIICDVQLDDQSSDSPLIWRLADPSARCANIGALIAVERAARRDVSAPVPFNLTIDDIPLGYDYLNESMLEDFLTHIENRCARVHLDCAWIPTSLRISTRYMEILKNHRAGFVWHGMYRHVDHQKIDDLAADLEAGKHAMAINQHRYNVQLQPMIIFPFERASRDAEKLLLEEGFLGAAEQPRHDEGAGMPEYLRYSDVSCVHESGLRFLHRYESQFLTRDRMLALAALDMPILAFAHPRDVRLRRLSGILERGGRFSHFDHVLDFATTKGLVGQSLEEIARDRFAETN